MLLFLAAATALVCCAVAAEERFSCSAQGKRIKSQSLFQTNRLRTKSHSLLNLTSSSEFVAGVNITVHNAPGGERRPEDKHKWVVSLPETCSDADVHAFAASMPSGAEAIFLGTPSNTGLPCVLVLQATEAELREQIEAHPGAESAQTDLHLEEHQVWLAEAELAETAAAAGAAGNPEGLPEGEGLPDVPPRLLPENRHRLASLAEANTKQRMLFGMAEEEHVISGPWKDSSCGGPYKAFVFYPTGASVSKHPVITMGHGYTQFGVKVKNQLLKGFIRPMVELGGYVVVAHETAQGWCDTSSDMLYVLDWVKQQDKFSRIIQPDKSAVVGYSMGGRSTLEVAHSDADIQKHNIVVAAALMPPCKTGCATSHIPVFLGAGTADTHSPDDYIEQTYEQVVGVDKALCNVAGAPHWEVGEWGKNRHETHLLQFLGCYLKGAQDLCDKIFSSECLSSRATGM